MTKTRKTGGQRKAIELTEKRKPHEIDYYDGPERNIETEKWTKNGRFHRLDGPAFITYFDDINNGVRSELWYKDGFMHRKKGPAEVRYGRSGALEDEVWWMDGKRMPTTGKYKKGGKTRRKRRRRKGTKKRQIKRNRRR